MPDQIARRRLALGLSRPRSLRFAVALPARLTAAVGPAPVPIGFLNLAIGSYARACGVEPLLPVPVLLGYRTIPFLSATSSRYFGMDRYVRPMDSSSRFWQFLAEESFA
jgi:hypothetical protein